MNIDYIELFSGIGAFSQAIENLNYVKPHCVFAADIDKECATVYWKNYEVDSLCDLTKKNENDIPKHNFCFFSPPCQAFSKSGKQKGFEDTRGTLIYEVFRILNKHKPKYILMENVRNLVAHNDGKTIKVILDSLHNLGYRTTEVPLILSPHYFGVPQTRERAFLPGIYDPENVNKPLNFTFGTFIKKENCNLYDIIDHSYDDDKSLKISDKEIEVLDAWNDFYQGIDLDVIGFPVWYDYFYQNPITEDMPDWKRKFVENNQKLYQRNKEFITEWEKKYNYLRDFNPTQRKFEWQAGTRINSIWEGVIQSRPSGIRVKAPTTLPALVAIVQIPIIGSLKRRLSVRECANLQSFSKDFIPDENRQQAYKQFGNSINVRVLQEVLDRLLKYKD